MTYLPKTHYYHFLLKKIDNCLNPFQPSLTTLSLNLYVSKQELLGLLVSKLNFLHFLIDFSNWCGWTQRLFQIFQDVDKHKNVSNIATHWPSFLEHCTLKYSSENLELQPRKNLDNNTIEISLSIGKPLYRLLLRPYVYFNHELFNIELLWSHTAVSTARKMHRGALVKNGIFCQKCFECNFLNSHILRHLHLITFY